MTAPVAPTIGVVDRPFIVRLDAFSGPLDLLLHLLQEQEIDITDIPIATVADQFLEVLDQLGLNGAAEYLDMAAQLLRIKIQMLLPRPFDEEGWEDPRAELVRRLLEYEQIREVSRWFAHRAGEQAERFPRGWLPEAPAQPPPPVLVDVADLLIAVEQVIAAMPQPVLHRVVPRPLDVEGATRRIAQLLQERAEFDLWEAVGERPSAADVLSVLLALLELARLGRVMLTQHRTFGTVAVSRERADSAA